MIAWQVFIHIFYHFRKILIKRPHDASSGYDRLVEKSFMSAYWYSRSNVLIYILLILTHIVTSNKYNSAIDIYEANITE